MPAKPRPASASPVLLAFGGFCALAAAMGIGRFALTPVLPFMSEAIPLSAYEAGLIASSNYLGYLIGALAVMAVANRGCLLNAPDTYMQKLATGPEGIGVVSLAKTPTENVHALAEVKGRKVSEIAVVVLERDRHRDLVAELRGAGARVFLISDGDVAPAIATCVADSGIDMVYGTGGAPEGVLAAAALHCLGGCFQGRLQWRSTEERERAIGMGLKDPDRHLEMGDLVQGEVIFVATGVTKGPMLDGVRRVGDRLHLQTMALRASTGTRRLVETTVRADRFV